MKFRTKTILGVAIIELTLLGILVSSTFYLLENSNKKEIERRTNITSHLLKASLTDAMISYDLATLQSIVNEAMISGDIKYIRILDNNGHTIIRTDSAPSSDTEIHQDLSLKTTRDQLFDTQITIEKHGHLFGTVQFGIDLLHFENFLAQAQRKITLIAAIEIVLVAIFSLLLGTYLTKSLTSIQKASARIAVGDLQTKIPTKGNDELADTAKAFNIMVEALQQREKDRDEALQSAQEANEAKTRFLANMSHELRTPLNSIIGFTERLTKHLDKQLEPRHIDALRTVKKNGLHLLSLINTILDLSKISSGKMPIICDQFSLPDLLENILHDFSEVDGNHHFKISYHSELILLTTDSLKLKQIVINFLSNAQKYSPPGTIEIQVNTTELNGKDAVKIAILDQGKGVPEEMSHELFTQFSQFENEKHRDIQGTGLGLSLSGELAELLNGCVNYRRTEDDKTEFSVTVPAIHQAQ